MTIKSCGGLKHAGPERLLPYSVILWMAAKWIAIFPATADEAVKYPLNNFDINVPTLRCPALAPPPVIDGKLDEPAWQEAQRIPSLWTYGEDDSGVPPTAVALGWDKTNLYVGFMCGLPTAEEKPSAPPVKSDTVEIVLDGRKAGGELVRIEVDQAGKAVRGAWADGKEWRAAPGSAAGEKDIEMAAGARLGFRIVELGVPFSILKLKEPGDGASLGLKLRRKQERELKGANNAAGKVWASRKTWHAWPGDKAFQEPGKEGGGLLVLTTKPVVYFPFPEANLDADGFWWLWYRAYSTGIGAKLGMILEKDGRIERRVIVGPNFVKGKESVGPFADTEIATNNKFPCVGNYRIAFVAMDNAGNILYQTPPVAVYAGRLRLAGLLPAYYNDEEAIHVSVCFTGPADEIDRMASQQQKQKSEPVYYLRQTMRSLALEDGAGVEKDTYFFRERYVCLFRRSTNFGFPGLASVWVIRGLPPGKYGFKVQLLRNSAFEVASWQQNSWKKGKGLNIVEELPEQEFHILQPPEVKPPEPIKSVTVGPEGGILVNGKPFMPLGVYHPFSPEYNDRSLLPGLHRAQDLYHETIRRLGFNLIEGTRAMTPEDTVRQLDLAWKAGLYASLIAESPNWTGAFTDKEREGGVAKVQAAVGHPALFFIFQPDEILGYGGGSTHGGVPPAQKFYAAVRKIASKYLVFADTTSFPVYFPGPGRGVLETYAGFVDVIGIDSYSVGGCGNMRSYYDSARLVDSVVRPLGKTQVYVPQANVAAPIQYMPSPVELRAQALLTIMGGSKGVAWYAYASHGVYQENGLLEYPEGWAYMKKLNRDLLGLTEAVAGKRTEDVKLFPAEGAVGVRMATPDKEYIFVANLDRAPKMLAVEKPEMKAGTPIAVHGECRTLLGENGGWADRFGPYEIHVYMLKNHREKKLANSF